MPDFTSGGVQFPLGVDTPRRQDIEDLARSIDDPQGVAWAGKSRRLTNTSGQSIPNSALVGTTLTGWGTSGGDQGDATGITLAGGIITVSESGIYFSSVFITFTANVTGQRRLFQNPGAISGRSFTTDAGASASIAQTVGPITDVFFLNAGDQIITQAGQNSGGALTLNTSVGASIWAITKLRTG